MSTKVMSTSDNSTQLSTSSPHTDLELQNDQLWSIITQQKNVIRDLETIVARLTKERDSLLLRSTTPPATPPSPLTQEPVPPPRSPYRQHYHHRRSHDGATVDTTISPSSTTTTTTTTTNTDYTTTNSKAGPIHAILDKDAELFANYQKTTTKNLTPSSSLSSGVNEYHDTDKEENKDDHQNATSTTESPPTPPPPPPQQQQTFDTLVTTPTDLNTNNYASFCTTMKLKVLEINVQHILKNKETISFILSISRTPENNEQELWRIKKGYSEFMALDTLLRSHLRSLSSKSDTTTNAIKMAKLPAKSLFTTTKSANTNMDQKKRVIEKYLSSVIRLPLPETMDLIQFLTTGILKQKEPSSSISTTTTTTTQKQSACEKEGHLSLYEKQSKKWHSYYFILHGSTLDYYDSNDGPLIDSISLKDSQMTVQRSSTSGLFYHTAPRSTMTITRASRTLSAESKHQQYMLRMTSDTELDEWARALSTIIQPMPQISRSECINITTSSSTSSIRGNSSHLPCRKRISNRILPSTKQRSPPQRSQSDNSVHSGTLTPSITTTLAAYHRTLSQPQQQPHQRQRKRSSIDAIFYSTRRTSPPLSQQDNNNTHHYQETPSPSIRHTPSISSLLPSASTSLLTRRHDTSSATMTTTTGTKKAANKLNRRTFWPKSIFLGHDNTNTNSNGLRSFLTRHSSDNLSASASPSPVPSSTTTSCRTTSTSTKRQLMFDQQRHVSLTKIPVNPIFGVPLEKALQVSKTHGLPTIVYRCIQFLERKKAIYEEGIYRISGSTIKIKGLRRRFDEQGDIDLLTLEEYRDCDIHAVSGLLKLWLRELPGHILTDHLIDSFILVKDSSDRHECINKLARLISKLPPANHTLLRALMAHLHYVTRNANVNKMTLRNMGIVFSPTLGIPTPIFDLFLCEFDTLFTSRRKQHRTTTSDIKNQQTTSDSKNQQTTTVDGNKNKTTTTTDRRLTVTFGTSRVNGQRNINQDNDETEGMELVGLDRPRTMIKT